MTKSMTVERAQLHTLDINTYMQSVSLSLSLSLSLLSLLLGNMGLDLPEEVVGRLPLRFGIGSSYNITCRPTEFSCNLLPSS